MGGATSSTKMTNLIQTLKNEHCSSTHIIWNSVNLSEFSNLALSNNDILDLIIIQKGQPDNFSELIKVTISILKNSLTNYDNRNYISLLNFICLLLAISNDPNRSTHFNFWFKTLNVFKSDSLPISNLIQAIENLLDLNDDIESFLNPAKIELKINCAKTLLFAIHAQSLFGFSLGSNSSEFLLQLNCFKWKNFLYKLFDSIIFISNKNSSIDNDRLICSLISIAIPCISSCSNWNISEIDIKVLYQTFYCICKSNSQKISNSEHYITLFYQISVKCPNFIQIFIKNDFIHDLLSYFIFVFDSQFETKKNLSFLHFIILTLLIKFTSNYTVVLSLALNNFYGLFIELITNPLIENISKSHQLTFLVSIIILNISSVANHLTIKSSNRLCLVLRQIYTNSYLFNQNEFKMIINNLIAAIYQFIRFHYEDNFNLFLCLLENQHFLNNLKIDHDIRFDKIMFFINKVKSIQKLSDSKLRIEKYKQLMSTCLMNLTDKPIKFISYELSSIEDFDNVWFDWLRLLFLITFPIDATRARLTFKTQKKKISRQSSINQLQSNQNNIMNQNERHKSGINETNSIRNQELQKNENQINNQKENVIELNQTIKQQKINQIDNKNNSIQQIEKESNEISIDNQIENLIELNGSVQQQKINQNENEPNPIRKPELQTNENQINNQKENTTELNEATKRQELQSNENDNNSIQQREKDSNEISFDNQIEKAKELNETSKQQKINQNENETIQQPELQSNEMQINNQIENITELNESVKHQEINQNDNLNQQIEKESNEIPINNQFENQIDLNETSKHEELQLNEIQIINQIENSIEFTESAQHELQSNDNENKSNQQKSNEIQIDNQTENAKELNESFKHQEINQNDNEQNSIIKQELQSNQNQIDNQPENSIEFTESVQHELQSNDNENKSNQQKSNEIQIDNQTENAKELNESIKHQEINQNEINFIHQQELIPNEIDDKQNDNKTENEISLNQFDKSTEFDNETNLINQIHNSLNTNQKDILNDEVPQSNLMNIQLTDDSLSTESLLLKKIDKMQDEIDDLLEENLELMKESDFK